MNKQNIATTIVLILCAITFSVVGTCFMTYIYENTKIVVENPAVVAIEQVLVYDKDDEQKTQLTKLKFSNLQLGLKPVTGELDAETKIPSTVTNKNGSEGLYATFVVDASVQFQIVIKNIVIETNAETKKIDEERENIFASIMDKENGAKPLDKDQVVLSSEEACNAKEFVLLFWLDAKTSENLKGAKISFEVHFIV